MCAISPCLSLIKTAGTWFRAHGTNPGSPPHMRTLNVITTTKTPFPYRVTFTGSEIRTLYLQVALIQSTTSWREPLRFLSRAQDSWCPHGELWFRESAFLKPCKKWGQNLGFNMYLQPSAPSGLWSLVQVPTPHPHLCSSDNCHKSPVTAFKDERLRVIKHSWKFQG